MSSKKQLLKWYKALGVEEILTEKPINRLEEAKNMTAFNDIKPLSGKSSTMNLELGISLSRQVADRCNDLSTLEAEVKKFEGCEIKKGALNTVFGDGNPKSKIMFIGEAPGASEDEQGIPFCGQSGKLLNNIIAAIDLDRTNSYITNTVFWRPPGNRRPTTLEIETCRPFVEKHVSLVDPKLIILVGNTAVESLLNLKVPMHSLRGRYFDYTNKYLSKSVKVAVIFHPSYLLRQQQKKKEMWLDVARIKQDLIDPLCK